MESKGTRSRPYGVDGRYSQPRDRCANDRGVRLFLRTAEGGGRRGKKGGGKRSMNTIRSVMAPVVAVALACGGSFTVTAKPVAFDAPSTPASTTAPAISPRSAMIRVGKEGGS